MRGPMTPLGKALGAQFEISVDGKPRSYRDRKAVAIEAAEYLKWKHRTASSGRISQAGRRRRWCITQGWRGPSEHA
jgi:hypothetical protein